MPTLSFKAAPSEAQSIRAAAKAKRLSLSEYLRRAALPQDTVRPKLRMKTDRNTGLSFAVMPPGAPKLGLSDVKRILADFP
jgi:hypothetical protein